MSALIVVTGNLGRDSELKYTQGGKPMLTFSMGVQTGYGEFKATSWWKCVMFGSRAEKLAQYFVKGTKLLVSGEPTIKKYEKKDGSTGYDTSINVRDFEFIGDKKQADNVPF